VSKLIVSGDSWTAGVTPTRKDGKPQWLDDRTKTIDFDTSIPWPYHLAEKLDMEVINVGLGGTGNEYIYNNMIDVLCQEKNIGLAICCWTEFERIDFNYQSDDHFGCRTSVVNQEDYFDAWKNKRAAEKLKPFTEKYRQLNLYSDEWNLVKSLRWFNAFQNFCENENIPFLQVSACTSIPHKILSYMINLPIFYKINSSTFLGWPISPEIGGWSLDTKLDKNLRISEEDCHPNTEGHKKISEYIYETIRH